jgi:hypothetical protein
MMGSSTDSRCTLGWPPASWRSEGQEPARPVLTCDGTDNNFAESTVPPALVTKQPKWYGPKPWPAWAERVVTLAETYKKSADTIRMLEARVKGLETDH